MSQTLRVSFARQVVRGAEEYLAQGRRREVFVEGGEWPEEDLEEEDEEQSAGREVEEEKPGRRYEEWKIQKLHEDWAIQPMKRW